MISDPYFYVVAVLSVFFHGMGKAGFGLGLPILAIPLMSLFIPPLQALAILVIPLIFMDLVTIRRFWSLWDINLVKSIIPLTLVGVIIGTITYSFLSDNSEAKLTNKLESIPPLRRNPIGTSDLSCFTIDSFNNDKIFFLSKYD